MNCNLEELYLLNIDIWENVFQYFNIKEQLLLTQVCWQFRNNMKSLWKRKFKELKLYKIEDADVVLLTNQVDNEEHYNVYSEPMCKYDCSDYKITDVCQKSSVLLNYEEVVELLDLNLDNLKKLQIIENKEEAIELEMINKKSCFFGFLIRNDLPQLTTLNLFGIKSLSADTLNKIKLCCPQLETLILDECSYNDRYQAVLEDHRGISAIASMKMLKTLIIKEKLSSYKLMDILCLIGKLQHVRQLVLKINIFNVNSNGTPELTTISNPPENLCQLININLDVFDNKMLLNFVNLQVLAINGCNKPLCVSNDILENLQKTCRHLKNLYLNFCNIENFVAIPSLETLTLSTCSNLTWMELKSILSQQNLQSFTSVFTRFSGIFKHFYIESPLEYLRLETMEYDFRDELKQLLLYNCQKMSKLNTLIWHDYTLFYLDGEPIAMHLPLQGTFHNLKSIIIDLSVIAWNDLLEMKCLKHLALVDNDNEINIDNIFTIFKHPTLETFAFYTRNMEIYSAKITLNTLTDYKINLRSIQIPLSLFNKIRNTWLNLLFANYKLQLVCYFQFDCNVINGEYFKELLENPNFPARIKSFKICDLTIDCNDLKGNPAAVSNSINTIAQYYDSFKETMHLKL